MNVFAADASARVRENFDFGWRFLQGDATNAEQTAFADRDWKTVKVPHDWSMPGRITKPIPLMRAAVFLPTGIGWYRKHFLAPESLCDPQPAS
ncbi:MAG TPA: hypothetical protein VFC17_05740 [Candidatus Limnocylindrales bacterium]|nr:hypothetical protein [Candidatus Limnocylindrales bacterium]